MYQAVILIKTQIHERDEFGRCKPDTKSSNSDLITFKGNSLDEIDNKVKIFLNKVEEYAKQTEDKKE